ncbi:hydrogenase maturation nickel metallochaperone HypA [Frankia sp. CIT1]|uniref:hydrogenase maturation nickel metallochaperone HypA n=1 Tax=Frankia sp. CIT1 TaxID=2880974 RepID=UPI001EF422A3|nr:hydrogenase maturation nickel metallochaperone HypA [Frankia sp. CIT1]
MEWRNASDRLRCFACGCECDGGRLDPCPSCGGNGIVIVPADELTVLDWMT